MFGGEIAEQAKTFTLVTPKFCLLAAGCSVRTS